MFQLNPAPFCMLDEVDAPLDDSNTERYCQMVKRMSSQTQFVFISHSKITMEIAQQLVGVTMQEARCVAGGGSGYRGSAAAGRDGCGVTRETREIDGNQ